ncbi:MAG: ATP-binding cassette domain-containing protein [Actinomycetota bacterium]|nr:ATP-binding cassette domain-containing protein [Actinomycetota bacterium]
MGHVEVNGVGHRLPDGRWLFDDVSFRVGEGAKTALVGANGAGKTTLLKLVAGDLEPQKGSVGASGGLGVMRQMVTPPGDDPSVRDLLLSVAKFGVRKAATELDAAELALMDIDDEPTQLRYAQALADWADAGGYDAEVLWDTCTVIALGVPYERAMYRPLSTLSGGEQKRLVLEALLRGPDQVLLLDEPDNFLDVPGKRWLEARLAESSKSVLFVSHDRELLKRTAQRIVTIEGGGGPSSAWVHGGGFSTYHEARSARHDRLDELRRRWNEEHEKLKTLVRNLKVKATYNSDMASRYRAAQTRLRRFEDAGPPEARPKDQNVRMRLRGGRTGERVLTCEHLGLTGLMQPFDLELFYGERVAVLGSNGSGKSHFLRLLAGWGNEVPDPVAHTGRWKLGARVVPGHFAQTHRHPEYTGRTLLDILWHEANMQIDTAAPALARYELAAARLQYFDELSGGQQARFQILLLELGGATMLLLDEPTDNLDLASAEALEDGLESYQGTVVAVTHDRWFARSFDRFVVFGADGRVYESPEAVWDEGRVERVR